MIYIRKINPKMLINNDHITVSIIDSGFSKLPPYATLYGLNKNLDNPHGDRVLSIFTALDNTYPLPNLKLNLASYDPKHKYDGIINALKLLPKADILSISIAWEEHNEQIYQLLCEKANYICVPYSEHLDVPYPSRYHNTITCSIREESHADYCITPTNKWFGNSYATPAIARLLCYNKFLHNDEKNGVDVKDLFENHNINANRINLMNNNTIINSSCPHCNKKIKTKFGTPVKELPKVCPYCGRNIIKK